MTTHFDTWATDAADPPRCEGCGTLLRRGSRDMPGGAKTVACPVCVCVVCGDPVGPDGCLHDPAWPLCAADLRDCALCKYDMDRDYLEAL